MDDDRTRVIHATPETVSPLTDEEREALYGPLRAPVAPAADDEPAAKHEPAVEPARRRPLWRRAARVLGTAFMYAVIAIV